MAIPREIADQIKAFLRPLRRDIGNLISRVTINRADDSKGGQAVQVGAHVGEDIDDGEHFQPYGFSSVPEDGAEGVALFPGGDRSHPLVVVVGDRRYRPKAKPGGHVCIYHRTGAILEFTELGDIVATPAVGRKMYVKTAAGSTEPLVTLSEFNAHTHAVATTGTAAAQSGTASAPTPAVGTSVLEAE